MESAKLIAGLTRIVRDVGVAEDLAQDALVAALEQWPVSGVPENPGAWLMAAAKHRAIDHLRRIKLLDRKHEELGVRLEPAAPEPEEPAGRGTHGAARVGARSPLPDLQRGLFRDRRRRLDAARALRGRDAARPRAGGARAVRARGAWSGRAHGTPGLAAGGARGAVGRADPAARPEPRALGSSADPSRPGGAGAGGAAGR